MPAVDGRSADESRRTVAASLGVPPGTRANETPESGLTIGRSVSKEDEALKALARFVVGKTVLVEETFLLQRSVDEFGRFVVQSGTNTTG